MPAAKIDYQIDESVQKIIDVVSAKPYDDVCAREEWGWKPQYSLAAMVDTFLNGENT